MTARQSGGVGAFGWTLLGFLAGVAATLAVQLLLGGQERGEDQDTDSAAHAPPVVAITPKLPAPAHKPSLKTEPAASSAPASVSKAEAEARAKARLDEQVAEDAAAAGMTSRVRPAAPKASSDPSDPTR
ncbi:MAG: hypothetical protein P4L64_14505 [Caulobacteraceae bacterium]|nr:hypothetical protein [Caulobacteraceae bacterium]